MVDFTELEKEKNDILKRTEELQKKYAAAREAEASQAAQVAAQAVQATAQDPGTLDKLKGVTVTQDQLPAVRDAQDLKLRPKQAVRLPGFWAKWFGTKVRVAWFEKNCSKLIVTDMVWDNGLVVDKFWGRAAEIGPDIPPVEIQINKDTRLGFVIDGDKGTGAKVIRSGGLLEMTGTSKLVWAILDSTKLAEAFVSNITFRSKIIQTLIGIIVGIFLGRLMG